MDILNMVIFAGWIISGVEALVIVICRNDVLLNLNIMMNKTKGIKEVFIFNKDRTVSVEAHVPKDNAAIKRGNRQYTIDENTIFFDKNKGTQAIVIVEGDQFSKNPLTQSSKTLDPQLIENLGYEMYYAGKKRSEDEQKTLLMAAGAAAILALIAVLLGWLNLTSIGGIAATLGKLTAPAVGQVLPSMI